MSGGPRIDRIRSGSPYEPLIGYARAVVAGNFVHVSGTTGRDPDDAAPQDVVRQCRLALRRIDEALAAAGCGRRHVVRVRYILPDREEFPPCWPILRDAFGDHPPAATMIEAGLIDPAMRIEIEVTALLPATDRPPLAGAGP